MTYTNRLLRTVAFAGSFLLLAACGGGSGSSGGGGAVVPPTPSPPTGVTSVSLPYNGVGGDFGDEAGTEYETGYLADSGMNVSLQVTDIAPSGASFVVKASTGCTVNNAAETTDTSVTVSSTNEGACTVSVHPSSSGAAVKTVDNIFFQAATNRQKGYNPIDNLVFDNVASSGTSTVPGCADYTIDSLTAASSANVVVSFMGSLTVPNGPAQGSLLCFVKASLENNDSGGKFENTLYLMREKSSTVDARVEGGHFCLSDRSIISVGDSVSFTEVDQVSLGGELSPGGRTFDTGCEVVQTDGSFTAGNFSVANAFVIKTHSTLQSGGRGNRTVVYEKNADGSTNLVYMSDVL